MKLIEAYLRARHAAFVAERFNYLYSEKELQEIAGKVKELVKRAKETHCVYNNNASDYAIRSAKRFKEVIEAIPAIPNPERSNSLREGGGQLRFGGF